MEQKLSELTAENEMLKNRMRSKTTEDSTRLKASYIQVPEIINVDIEADLIDEQTSNVPSMSSSSLPDDEMDESSNDDESAVASVGYASDEVELCNESVEATKPVEPMRLTLKRKTL